MAKRTIVGFVIIIVLLLAISMWGIIRHLNNKVALSCEIVISTGEPGEYSFVFSHRKYAVDYLVSRLDKAEIKELKNISLLISEISFVERQHNGEYPEIRERNLDPDVPIIDNIENIVETEKKKKIIKTWWKIKRPLWKMNYYIW